MVISAKAGSLSRACPSRFPSAPALEPFRLRLGADCGLPAVPGPSHWHLTLSTLQARRISPFAPGHSQRCAQRQPGPGAAGTVVARLRAAAQRHRRGPKTPIGSLRAGAGEGRHNGHRPGLGGEQDHHADEACPHSARRLFKFQPRRRRTRGELLLSEAAVGDAGVMCPRVMCPGPRGAPPPSPRPTALATLSIASGTPVGRPRRAEAEKPRPRPARGRRHSLPLSSTTVAGFRAPPRYTGGKGQGYGFFFAPAFFFEKAGTFRSCQGVDRRDF